jgi:hypothetical protein
MSKFIPISLGIVTSFFILFSSALAQLETVPEAPTGEEAGIEEETPALEEEARPTGNIVNSKYLSITEHRYRSGDFSDQITGVVVNNSTQEISGVSVDAALYDKDNKLITMAGAGFADVSTLPPDDNSAFSINILGVQDIDHYTLFPSGTP